MPGMDGWTVLSTMKQDAELRDVPVVILTMTDDATLGYALGAADFITKPVDRTRLLQILARHIPAQGQRTALVVEDDAPTREVLRRILEQDGWEVAEATDGVEALVRLGERRPDVVLCDLMMPNMDGFELIHRMHEHEVMRTIPVLVVTAKEMTREDEARLNGSVEKILQKGTYSREQLLTHVRGLLKQAV